MNGVRARTGIGGKTMRIHETKILIADGTPASVALVKRALREMGFFSVQTAANGYSALIMLKKNPIDLLLLDWRLPTLDGPGILSYLRRIPWFRLPKIIGMIANSDRETITRGAELGLNTCLVRPFTGRTLRNRIEKEMRARIM